MNRKEKTRKEKNHPQKTLRIFSLQEVVGIHQSCIVPRLGMASGNRIIHGKPFPVWFHKMNVNTIGGKLANPGTRSLYLFDFKIHSNYIGSFLLLHNKPIYIFYLNFNKKDKSNLFCSKISSDTLKKYLHNSPPKTNKICPPEKTWKITSWWFQPI